MKNEMEPAQKEFVLKEVTKSYGSLRVLDGISLTVEKNRIAAVLGPSGCGKTTLLSLVAGSLLPDSGEILGLAGKAVSFLFQEPRLLDWLTVAENIAFVLKDRFPPAEVEAKVAAILRRVELSAYRDSYPRRLSGGQRQRVAMARAWAYPSRLLLMDEPYKSLDLGLKLELIRQFLQLWTAEPRTVLYVTHDIKEALLLADEIYLLSAKPAVIRSRYTVPIPRSRRRLDDYSLLTLERKITGELLQEEEGRRS
ncbi:MAG: ABC transporter ATP-binding protein [Firmicutes bacterium]|nr:ABC transporter ATP-binding protein [Bacillota bacterium]